ncbi:MAG: flagellar motor protein MotB [Terriglobia bacterium]|nr:MAG: flagellar motor protein MotB [Terriglobia bacterium]
MFSTRKLILIAMAAMLAMFAAGCKKKVPPPPPPPPPAPAPVQPTPPTPVAPRITQFSAEPTSIQRGQSSTLRWEVTGETTSIAINNGIGAVMAAGNQRVFPNGSTTYTLTATGPGGTTTASATINVTEPPPPPAPARQPPPTVSFETRLSTDVQDAYFDYDKSDIRSDARDALNKDAAALKSILADFPNASIVIEGHCDERGSAEYNLGLGDRRGTAAKDFLTQLGIPADRLKTISYGKERPQCTDSNETCWQRNRRAHFAPGQ